MVARRVSQLSVESEVLNETPEVRISQALVESEINQHRAVLVSQVIIEVEATPVEGYVAFPAAMFEIQWDGTNWTDETAYVLLPDRVSYTYGLLGQHGLADLGQGVPVASLTLRLANAKEGQVGRFSEERAGSQAEIFGLFQRKVRFSAGYGDDLAVIFIGRVQDIDPDERTGTVGLTCHGLEADLLQEELDSIAREEMRPDELIAEWAYSLMFAPTDLERCYTLIPWYYMDSDSVLSDMREVAETEGAIAWVDPQDGTLKLWTWPHWVGAASEIDISRGWVGGGTPSEGLKVRRRYADTRDVVNVTFTPRRKGRLRTVHRLTRPVVIPASSSVQQRFRFNAPVAGIESYSVRARSSGGQNMDAYLTIGATTPSSATEWVTTLSNSHATQAIVVDKFDVFGYPLEGLPNREYRAEGGTLAVSRRHNIFPGQEPRPLDVRSRFGLQTDAQARLIADLKLTRLASPRAIQIGPMPGDSSLRIGSVVTVNFADAISAFVGDVVLLHRSGSWGGPPDACRWEETWMGVPLGDLYEYTTISEGAEDGYFAVGTSLLGVGRLGY